MSHGQCGTTDLRRDCLLFPFFDVVSLPIVYAGGWGVDGGFCGVTVAWTTCKPVAAADVAVEVRAAG